MPKVHYKGRQGDYYVMVPFFSFLLPPPSNLGEWTTCLGLANGEIDSSGTSALSLSREGGPGLNFSEELLGFLLLKNHL